MEILKVVDEELKQRMAVIAVKHCVKSVQIRSFFWSLFIRIRTEYGEILRISLYSARIWENTDQKNLVFGHFSLSES